MYVNDKEEMIKMYETDAEVETGSFVKRHDSKLN